MSQISHEGRTNNSNPHSIFCLLDEKRAKGPWLKSLRNTAIVSSQHILIRTSCFCLLLCGSSFGPLGVVDEEVGNSKVLINCNNSTTTTTTWNDKRMVRIKTKPRRFRKAWRNLKKKGKWLPPTSRQYSVKKVANTIKFAPPPLKLVTMTSTFGLSPWLLFLRAWKLLSKCCPGPHLNSSYEQSLPSKVMFGSSKICVHILKKTKNKKQKGVTNQAVNPHSRTNIRAFMPNCQFAHNLSFINPKNVSFVFW